MRTVTEYRVALTHPTNFHSGVHTIRVYHNPATQYQGEHFFCSGDGFGTSRDYLIGGFFGVKDAKAAIGRFLAEHACTVTKATKKRAA